MSKVVSLVLAAGSGTRMNLGYNKIFTEVLGQPLLLYSLVAFQASSVIDEIILVSAPDEVPVCEDLLLKEKRFSKVTKVISGGLTRHQSERNGLHFLRERILSGEIEYIFIHDAARPFINERCLIDLYKAVQRSKSATLGLSVTENFNLVYLSLQSSSIQSKSPSSFVRMQTPQAFDAEILLKAYDQAAEDGYEGTDTCASVERSGNQVSVVFGDDDNIKVTTWIDLIKAENILKKDKTRVF